MLYYLSIHLLYPLSPAVTVMRICLNQSQPSSGEGRLCTAVAVSSIHAHREKQTPFTYEDTCIHIRVAKLSRMDVFAMIKAGEPRDNSCRYQTYDLSCFVVTVVRTTLSSVILYFMTLFIH